MRSDGVSEAGVLNDLREKFKSHVLATQETGDGVPTVWVDRESAPKVLRYLKSDIPRAYPMLFDLTAIDERLRNHRSGQPPSDFTVVYHLVSFERNEDMRVKVPLRGGSPSLDSVAGIYACADWYEREAWDMFGVTFSGHPHLKRILLPQTWKGHPLRKEYPARATENAPFSLPDAKRESEQAALRFDPEEWGMKRESEDTEFLFLNLGPQHPGTHGLLRVVLQLDGEEIVDAVPDIGYHHRGAEKMAERQTWHNYIPYTDRIDYTGGLMNNLPYVLAVEKLAGIRVPDRVNFIRVMLVELCRIMSHLVWYGTFAQDLGSMSPVFYTFNDREQIFRILEALCGGRMHPMWFRIGGVAQDLPGGWDTMIRDFIRYFTPKLREYDRILMKNRIFKMRTVGIGRLSLEEALEWGVTGPNLRSWGLAWDLRKKRPYSGYDQFEFDIPTASGGDCYDRAVVRVEEMRQCLRILEQCVDNMPSGPYKADHPLATPPRKERTMHDIETLITHFLGVSWGPIIPPGEVFFYIEATKGMSGYYLISDGENHAYRARIRTPSFPHMQVIPVMSRGWLLADLVSILGSIDFVLADVDR
jgi:NADH-quinone oxidoreductase subunit C/D